MLVLKRKTGARDRRQAAYGSGSSLEGTLIFGQDQGDLCFRSERISCLQHEYKGTTWSEETQRCRLGEGGTDFNCQTLLTRARIEYTIKYGNFKNPEHAN